MKMAIGNYSKDVRNGVLVYSATGEPVFNNRYKYHVTAFWAMPDAIPTSCWHVVAVRNGKADWKNGIVATFSDYDVAYAVAEASTKALDYISL
jgi:hypothetical protein